VTDFLNNFFHQNNFSEIPEVLKGLIIILVSLVSEDVALFSSVVLHHMGQINFYTLIIASFFGILLGDLSLYSIGRFISRGKKTFLWFSLEKYHHKKKATKQIKGLATLFLARFIPGIRLPIYVSSGAIKYPLWKFMAIDVFAIPIWIYLVLTFGKVLLTNIQQNYLLGLLAIVLVVVFLKIIKSLVLSEITLPLKYRVKKLLAGIEKYRFYEFWPSLIFYFPCFLAVLFQAIKYRGKLILPIISNPAIYLGGVVGENKKQCYSLLDSNASYYLDLIEIKQDIPLNKKIKLLEEFSPTFPVILKPEKGQRGAGVALIKDASAAKNYFLNADYNIVAQKFCDYKNEAGVFYIRYPNSKKSQIFSITDKIFPSVIGDGKRNLAKLILDDKRARLINKVYFLRLKNKLMLVPKKDEVVQLVGSGNHAQGTIFKDGMDKIYTKELHKKFDEIAGEINGFYFGRFDVRYQDVASFRRGENFKIIEINGASSEATHIYDRKFNLLGVYGVLFKQINMLYQISYINYKNGVKIPNTKIIFKEWFSYLSLSKKYPVSF